MSQMACCMAGLNQREQDFYSAWQQVMRAIHAEKPDVVLHAGDLFHTPRPSNRAIRVALESIRDLNDAGIPLVLVSGNHETPRIRATGSIFESIDLYPNVHTAFNSRYERFRIDGVDFHCLPHCSLSEELEAALNAVDLQADSDANVMISHGAWSGKQLYGMGEFNEQRLPDVEGRLGRELDYIALGHYHRYLAIKPHVCYSGSTERTSLNEHNTHCGYIVLDLESKKHQFHDIDTRPMLKLQAVDCTGLASPRIYDQLQAAAATVPDGAIVQVSLINLENDAFLKLDSRQIDELFSHAFTLEKHISRKLLKSNSTPGSLQIESLSVEFARYLDHLNLEKSYLNELIKKAADYLE